MLTQFLNQPISPVVLEQRLNNIIARAAAISPNLAQPNFTVLATEDLRTLYQLYQEEFFGGCLTPLPVSFSLSTRMTRAAGKTIYYHQRQRFILRISFLLLQQNFADDTGAGVSGLTCSNRREALMRVMEHEMVHILEFTHTGKSSCGQKQFKMLAAALFGHKSRFHRLVTNQDKAYSHNLLPGMPVRFNHQGREYKGVINRITRRATVLVPNPLGFWRDDKGRRYNKFYVPLHLLQKEDD